jgi:hypothetical protein
MGTVNLRLHADAHETTHDFHVIGNSLRLLYDGFSGRDFWEQNKAAISYCNREILMVDIINKFDPKDRDVKKKIYNFSIESYGRELCEASHHL